MYVNRIGIWGDLMKKEDRRAARCALEYTSFVLLLLLAVGVMMALFHVLGGNMPSSASTLLDTSASERQFTVILDAGHGGEDGGAVGKVNGRDICEKELNLSIAWLLRDLLAADNVNVIMTREQDVLLYNRNTDYEGRKKALDLAARLAIGQTTENALFVSIHMNAFPQTQYHGLQVYYSPNHPLSQTLAEDMQTRVCEQLQSDNHRKIKRAGSDIYLLEHLDCPAVLVECGFLSNPEECAQLTDPVYRRQIAFLLFCSIRECMTADVTDDATGGAIAVSANILERFVRATQIVTNDLIFSKKYYIM